MSAGDSPSTMTDGWHVLAVPEFKGELSVLFRGGAPVSATMTNDEPDDVMAGDDVVLDALELLTGRWYWVGAWEVDLDDDGRTGATAAIREGEAQPTHRIAFAPADGSDPTVTLVHFMDEDEDGTGSACDRAQWAHAMPALWRVDDYGRWVCGGKPTPGCAPGTVTVAALGPARVLRCEDCEKVHEGDPTGQRVTEGVAREDGWQMHGGAWVCRYCRVARINEDVAHALRGGQ